VTTPTRETSFVAPSRQLAKALVLASLLAIFGAFVALQIGGAAEAPLLGDPGVVVRWGLPLIKAASDFAMAGAIGGLVFATFALPDRSKVLGRALDFAGLCAGAWTLLAALGFVFTYLDVTGTAFSTANAFGNSLWFFATNIELGKYLGFNLCFAAAVTILALLARSLTATALIAALAVAGLVPLALTGHASGIQGHSMAVNALGLHLLGATIWVGGLAGLLFVAPRLKAEELRKIAKRYSTLALAAFLIVAVSGVASASVRIGSWQNLFTPYGLIVALKVMVLISLAAFGAYYRARVLNGSSKKFAVLTKLAVAELGIMGLAFGLATALARTAPPFAPAVSTYTTPAQILTGETLPPELTMVRYFTEYKLDLIWSLVALAGIILYWVGFVKLRRRGDAWSVARPISWTFGMLTLFYITSGALNVYEPFLFSTHMFAHMLLTMGVPLFLVPAAPITLLLRALEKRSDDSRNLRDWALWAVHTKFAQFVSNPIVAGINFAVSLVVFYYTPLFSWATHDHLGHEWMTIHFLITGYLFVQALIGVDPGPAKLDYPIRLMLLIGTLAFHAFFGLALMTGQGLLLADWFGSMGRTWGQSPLEDQQTGGGIAWGIGEIPAAVLTLIVSIQWARSDERDSKRLDRKSDRSGNQDLQDYNDMLARLSKRGERS
jgi:putative copper resistance protein D